MNAVTDVLVELHVLIQDRTMSYVSTCDRHLLSQQKKTVFELTVPNAWPVQTCENFLQNVDGKRNLVRVT